MSIRTVNREINKAVAWEGNDCTGPRVTEGEAEAIVDAAEKGKLGQPTPITPGEAKAISDLFDRTPVAQPQNGAFMTMACPESGSDPRLEPGAAETFNAFFVRNALPYGENLAKVKAQIDDVLSRVRLGEPLAEAPNVSRMHHVFLRDQRVYDGPRSDAYVDAEKGEFFLKMTGSGMAGPGSVGPFWYGPLALPAEQPGVVTAEKLDAMRAAFQDVDGRGLVEWRSRDALPQDLPLVSAELMRERHPDGFTYTALIPGGRSPFMPPDVPGVDPNAATYFFVERTGGFAGLTQVAGPFSLETPSVEQIDAER